MIYYDGIYRLRSKNDPASKARKDWAYAWRVRIIDLAVGSPQVRFIKPIVVFVTPAGDGLFKANCAENLGKSICRDFDLSVPRLLWAERIPSRTTPIMVACFIPKPGLGPAPDYRIDWREIRKNELETIQSFLPESELADYG